MAVILVGHVFWSAQSTGYPCQSDKFLEQHSSPRSIYLDDTVVLYHTEFGWHTGTSHKALLVTRKS